MRRSLLQVLWRASLALCLGAALGCSSTGTMAPIRTAEFVDIEQFMGDWFVLGNIPTFIEKEAFNAVESYALADEGRVDTTFSFRKGSFEGKQKVYHPTGFIRDAQTNAVWGMQFIWPIKAEYRVLYVSEDYQQTIIGRSKRDYLWIMARTSALPEEKYEQLVRIAVAEGYRAEDIRRVPQRWNDDNS